MSSSQINLVLGQSAARRVVQNNSFSSCFPCERPEDEDVAVSTLATMKLGIPRDEARASTAVPVPAEGVKSLPPKQQQPDPANVGQLVTKAKKAATSLWMILHAQNCRNCNCPHRGCSETKLILAHVKSCPAGPGFPCPTQCKGCNETRKLLSHYRRCKDLRMKQVGLGRRSGLQPDSSCLVCSLMARYAKNMLDRSKSTSSQGKNNAASLLSSSLEGKFKLERGMANFSDQASTSPAGGPRRTPSGLLMPPPPPRSNHLPLTTSIHNSSSNESFFGTSLNPSQLANPFLADSTLCSLSLLCKSVDSNVRVPFPILKRPSTDVQTGDSVELVVPGPVITRQRSVSYDERKNRVKFSPTLTTTKQYYIDEHGAVPEEDPSEQIMNNARPRSASCSNMASNDTDETSSSSHGCETIAEEGVEYEQPVFAMD